MSASPPTARDTRATIATLALFLTVLVLRPPRLTAADLAAQDGLRLTTDDRGAVVQVAAQGRQLPLHQRPGGFLLLDCGNVDLAPKELVKNGDFSNGPDAWTFGAGWTIHDDPDLYRKGKSAFIDFPGPEQRRSSDVRQHVPVLPGTPYQFSLSMKTGQMSGTPPHVWLGMLAADGRTSAGPQLTLSHSQRDSGGEWFVLRREFTTTPDTHFLVVRWGIWRGYGKAWVDDVSLQPMTVDHAAMAKPVPGSVRTVNDATLAFRADMADDQLQLNADFTVFPGRIRCEGALRDTSGRDRALMLWFRLPLALDSTWSFDYDLRRQIAIGENPVYVHALPLAPSQTCSQYPWACVNDKTTGLAVSVPMDRPCVYRLAYRPSQGLDIAFDLGLTKATAKFPQRANFAFDLFLFPPEWGFRAAAQRYYELFPEFFHEWPDGHGSWSAGIIDWVRELRPLDYGIRWQVFNYHQNRDVRDDTAAQVLTVRYMEPNGYWGWRLGVKPMPALTQMPPYDEQFAQLQTLAEDGQAVAKRILQTGLHDVDAHLARGGWVPRWGGTHWQANPDPDLPDAKGSVSNLGTDSWDDCEAHCRNYHLVGSYTDAGPSRRRSFRRDHFVSVDYPLTFDYATKTLCVPPQTHSYELYDWFRDRLHANGWRFLVHWCGAGAPTYPFGIHLGDTIGNEQLSAPLNENQYLTQRALCYRKTIQAYLNHAKSMSLDLREAYCRRDTLYGVFSDPRDPVLGRLYVSIQRELARAGWEPVTGATAAGPDGLLIERFGRRSDGNLHVVVHNQTEDSVTGTLQLDTRELGNLDNALCQQVENLMTATAPTRLTDNTIPLALEPGAVRVLRIGSAEQLAMLWRSELERQWVGVRNYVHMADTATIPDSLRECLDADQCPDTAQLRAALMAAASAAARDPWIRHAALALAEADRIDSTMRLLRRGKWASLADTWPVRPGWPLQLTNGLEQTLPTQVLVNTSLMQAGLNSVLPGVRVRNNQLTVDQHAPEGLYPVYLEWSEPNTDMSIRLYADVQVCAEPLNIALLPAKLRRGRSTTQIALRLSNALPRALTGNVSLLPPAGWSVSPAAEPVAIEPRQTAWARFQVSPPAAATVGKAVFRATFAGQQLRAGAETALALTEPRPSLDCPSTDNAPTLDGTLDDACWRTAALVDDLPLQKGGKATQRTRVRMCHDAEAIYVAFECMEDRMPEVRAEVTQMGGPVWSDDAVEVFVVPWHRRACQFITNPIGTRYAAGADDTWKVAVSRAQRSWTAEFAIPYASLGAEPPVTGDIWGLNLGREEKPRAEVTAWSPPGYHHRDSDGDLIFR